MTTHVPVIHARFLVHLLQNWLEPLWCLMPHFILRHGSTTDSGPTSMATTVVATGMLAHHLLDGPSSHATSHLSNLQPLIVATPRAARAS